MSLIDDDDDDYDESDIPPQITNLLEIGEKYGFQKVPTDEPSKHQTMIRHNGDRMGMYAINSETQVNKIFTDLFGYCPGPEKGISTSLRSNGLIKSRSK